MKKLSYLIFTYIVAFSFSSCNKIEGCDDPHALNYNASADEVNNNLCRYTTATFYASSNTFTGDEVSEILLTIGQTSDTIGTITSFNQPYPNNCTTPGTVKYTFKTGNSQIWFAQYKLSLGGIVTSQGEFSPSSSEECIRIDVLP